MEKSAPRTRLIIFRSTIVLALALLATQLWRLQVAHGEEYRRQADHNRFRLISTNAPRGVIYDRQGRILVRNRPSFTVTIVPADLPSEQEDQVFARLSALLDIPVSAAGNPGSQGIKEMVEQGRDNPFSPIPIKTNVPRDVAFIIEEEHLELPGVHVEIDPIRQYVEGALVSHIVGYVGRIPGERVEEYTSRGYDPNEKVGLTGVEYTFEAELRGVKGRKHIEIDAAGREIRTLAMEPPLSGHNLVLTIDLDLQRAAEAALRQGMEEAGSEKGVVIAMSPHTGEILAMVSLPSYDNNLFAGGISVEDWARLTSDPRHPLINYAVSGQYPPGSTFKIIPAAAALQEGILNKATHLQAPGVILVPNKYAPDDPELAQPFYCWIYKYGHGHGSINIVEGIAQSCDVFFYKVGGGFEDFRGLGIERMEHYARLFGFGEKTGIDLPAEEEGLVPNDQWKRQTLGESWFTGDTYNMAIGQGFFSATPLQLLNAAAAVANGGTLYRPQIVYEVTDAEGRVIKPFAKEVIRQVPVSAENLAIVREGMRAAVTHGTARRTNLSGVAVAGKTGTAEYFGPRDKDGHLPTHAWFVAFAPYEDPQIVLVVFVEGGGEGSRVAVPIAREILRYYFNLPEEEPTEPEATPEATPQATPLPAAALTERRFEARLIAVE